MTHTITPRGLVRTEAGIEIGSAHIRKPDPMTKDAEKIQAALMHKRKRAPAHHVIRFHGAMNPRRRLPTLTPTTRVARLIAWLRSWF